MDAMNYQEQHPPSIGSIVLWMILVTIAAVLVALKSCT
jgi:hypothetical protein